MAVFLYLPGVTGDVQATNFKGWMQVKSADWSTNRNIAMQTGSNENREKGAPRYGEIVVKKEHDKGSAKTFDLYFKAQAFQGMQTKITWTRTGDTSALMKSRTVTLENVIISVYRLKILFNGTIEETLSLNYTKIQQEDFPAPSKNSAGLPLITGYNLVDPKPL